MAKVSLIMLVYKTEQFIEKSLRSALEQTFEDMEFVIVNDATPDGAMTVVERVLLEYPRRQPQVKIIDHLENRGSAVARQTGIDAATGEYTIFLDSDDWVELRMCERLYETVKKDDTDIVVCDHFTEFPKYQAYNSYSPPSFSGKEFGRALFVGGSWSLCDKLIRRSLYSNYDIMWTPGINNWEDLIATFKLSYFANKVTYLPEAFLHYRQNNPYSITTVLNHRTITDPLRATEEIERFVNAQPDYADYADDIIYLKSNAIMVALKNTRGVEQKKIARLYSDIPRRYIFKQPNIILLNRIYRYFASVGWLWFANQIDKVIKMGKMFLYGRR